MPVEVGVRGACKCSTRWAGVSMAGVRSNRGPSRMGIGGIIVVESSRKMMQEMVDGREEGLCVLVRQWRGIGRVAKVETKDIAQWRRNLAKINGQNELADETGWIQSD